ncbi:hypothetical protein ON010_g11892 [Phytophthora cinnamomi]|nr:hypothetical protein ON010_g11892 [Phytophthora cinnamomi]
MSRKNGPPTDFSHAVDTVIDERNAGVELGGRHALRVGIHIVGLNWLHSVDVRCRDHRVVHRLAGQTRQEAELAELHLGSVVRAHVDGVLVRTEKVGVLKPLGLARDLDGLILQLLDGACDLAQAGIDVRHLLFNLQFRLVPDHRRDITRALAHLDGETGAGVDHPRLAISLVPEARGGPTLLLGLEVQVGRQLFSVCLRHGQQTAGQQQGGAE